MSRVEEMLNELLKKKEEEEKANNKVLKVLAEVGVVAAGAGIAYAVYRFFAPDYLEDFEDDFDDEMDEDFFDENEFEDDADSE